MLLEEPVDMPSLDARKRQKTAKLKKKKITPRKKVSYIYKKKAENSFATQNFQSPISLGFPLFFFYLKISDFPLFYQQSFIFFFYCYRYVHHHHHSAFYG